MIRRIYPDQYKTSRKRRRLADQVMARAGVDKRDVCSLVRAKNRWHVNYFLRNEAGKFYLTADKTDVASACKVVPA